MKYYGILIILGITNIYTSYKCDIKQCSRKNLYEGVCVSPSTNTDKNITIFDINIDNCNPGQFCPYAVDKTKNTQCLERPVRFTRYDGQSCTNNTHCASNDCNSGKCQGRPENSPCNQNSECRVGYYCGTKDISSGVKNCLKQKVLNGQCETDEDCLNNMGCHNQQCVEYFSVKVGTHIKSGNWKLCETGKVYKDYCVSIKLEQDTYECKGEQTICKYSVIGHKDEKSMDIKCQCSNAYTDKNFCDVDSYNTEWIKLIDKLKDWYSQHNKNYHTDNRHNYHMDLYKRYKIMTEYPQHKDADVCLVDWELNYLSSSYIRNWFIILAIIMFIL